MSGTPDSIATRSVRVMPSSSASSRLPEMYPLALIFGRKVPVKVSRSGAWPNTIERVFDSPGLRERDAAAYADGVRLVVDCVAEVISLSEAPFGLASDEKKA